MIIYFSGTGNSLHVAKQIASETNDELVSVSDLINPNSDSTKNQLDFKIANGERFGIVFPVHSWGPPQVLLDAIDMISINFEKIPFVYAVATCGKNAGNSMKLVNKHLVSKGLKLNSAYTVVMPNNYIIIGDVYDKPKKEKILSDAKLLIPSIAKDVKERKSDIFRVEKGPLPFILTGLINRGFKSSHNKASKFHSTDACTGCKVCQNVCPCHNIIVEKTPEWGSNCSQCLACINYCPERAIEYGKSSVNKGRYVFEE